jgi:alpha-D-xyloside xylohydrolase
MHSANIHTMVSIWSQLEQGSPPFNTFSSSGWLWPTDNNCTTHFIDAYSSGAREAFWNLIRDNMFDTTKMGFDSWWLDNDEPFAYPCGFDRHSLTTAMGNGCLFYNAYTFPMTRMGYTNWRRDIPKKRFLILHRANFAGQQAHAAMQWSNDINCDWPTLKNSVPAGLNSAASGIPYWTTDIGGYWGSNGIDWSTAANNELFTRWFQYGSFCSVFRIHGNGPSKELYQACWSATTKANLLLADKLHYRLMPYIYSLAWMTTNGDYTPMRHLVFDFRTDPNIKGIGDQFMYGPAIMVSPVTTQGQTSRSVYLPAGKWYDFWTGAAVTGGASITADAPVSQIPLNIRAGSIIPMGPEIQYATERADTIELRVYPGANGSFTMYEDEGDNYNYETGGYATIPITYTDPRCVHIGARSGTFTGMQTNKVFNIVYVGSNHGVGEAKTATPDTVINYSGTDCGCGTGVGFIKPSALPGLPMHMTIRSYDAKIIMDRRYGESVKDFSVYDLKGRLVYKAMTKSNEIDFGKKIAASKAVYIVKINVVPKQ